MVAKCDMAFLFYLRESLGEIYSLYVLILTARERAAQKQTEKFLIENDIKYNQILFEMPMGERILINDDKPSGLRCAYAITPTRNQGLESLDVVMDENL